MESHFFNLRNKEIWFHLLFWIFIIANLQLNADWTDLFPDGGIILIIGGMIIPIYINALYLIPCYFNKQQWYNYLFTLTLLLVNATIFKALHFILSYSSDYMQKNDLMYRRFDFLPDLKHWVLGDFSRFDVFLTSPTAWIIYISFAYSIGKDRITNQRIKERLISENMKMKLALLKSQFNPHFLFNTLNSIYAIALEETAPRTADHVSKLGTLMRYSLQDAQEDFILISKEMNYLERYIEMQKLRMTDDHHLNVSISLDDSGLSNTKIAPMILMPLVENSFKHGVSTANESSIDIQIILSNEIFSMRIENTVHLNSKPVSGELGLKNVENRLSLIYPEDYKFFHGLKSNVYIVDLELNLAQ